MNDKNKNIAVIFVFIIIIFGLLIVNIFKSPVEVSKSERRRLAQFPTISFETVFNGKFMTDFEDYSLDQFVVRDTFRNIKALVSFNLFKKKDNNNIYFAEGHVSKYYTDLKEAEIKGAAKKFNLLYNKYLKDMNVYYSIIPDKNYYLANKNGYPTVNYGNLFSWIKDGMNDNIKYIDLTKILYVDDYYTTDIHWKQEKLFKVVSKYADVMGFNVSGEYEENVLEPFYGVYYGQSALPIPGEKLIYLTNEQLNNIKVFELDTDTLEMVPGELYYTEGFSGTDSYDVFLEGAKPLFIIENENATTDKELILFRDSFGSSLAPLLAEGYRKITVIDLRYIATPILEQYDLVDFKDGQDVLILYSTEVLNNSSILKVM